MRKKVIVTIASAMMVFGLVACGSTSSSSEDITQDEIVEETEEIAETNETEDGLPIEVSEDELEDVETEVEENENSVDTEETSVEAVSSDWITFDDMHFYVNGVKFTLGETTLQDMIDSGVQFKGSDLDDADNNIQSNYSSGYFRIEQDDYSACQVYVVNTSDEGMPARECVIYEIYVAYKGETSGDPLVTFDWGADVTMEGLVEKCGEPTETSHYDGDDGYYTNTYEYTQESEQYYLDKSYKFEFTKGALKYVTLEWLP